MQLRDALGNSPLSSGRVVAGGRYLDREISWVHVVDNPDFEPWVIQGQLLLSTGYSWPTTKKASQAIVERLAAKRVCGVVLAVPHFMDHFPKSSIKAADRVGLPLIELPWEVPLCEITQVVHRDLIDQGGRALAISEQIHRELTESAVTGHSLNNVAQVLGRVLGRTVCVHALDGAVLARSEIARPDGYHDGTGSPVISAIATFRALAARGTIATIDDSPYPVRIGLPRGAVGMEATPMVGYAARIRDERVCYFLVWDGSSPMSALDFRAIEHAGTVAALHISYQREIAALEDRLGYTLVASLIEGTFEDKPYTLERARLLGWNDTRQYRLCTVLLDEPIPMSEEGLRRRKSFADRVKSTMERMHVPPLISVSANQVHLLIPSEVDVDELWSTLYQSRIAMGVSQLHSGAGGMHRAGIETSELIEHMRPGRLHHSEEMFFPRVLSGDAAAQRAFVNGLLGCLQDAKRGQNLLETALALSEEGFHLQRTAERLGVHISTLRYRLGRLTELTGLDLESVEGRFRLQVAAHLYHMRQS